MLKLQNLFNPNYDYSQFCVLNLSFFGKKKPKLKSSGLIVNLCSIKNATNHVPY